jgi:hypothetical protein
MLALVDWPAEAAKAQEQMARAATEAAAEAAAVAAAASVAAEEEEEEQDEGDSVPDLETGHAHIRGGAAADRWAHLPRRGGPPAPTRPLQIIRSRSLQRSVSGSYGSLGQHDPATRMFAPGMRN